MKRLFLISILWLGACAPATQTGSSTEIVSVYATSAAEPWLIELYACADRSSVVLNFTATSPDISIRVGEPKTLVSPAYRIAEEEILIVTNRESPMQNLTPEEAQALFAGKRDPSVQVWAYAPREDLQVAFDALVMKGQPITSFARLAAGPQQMSDILNADENAVGIVSRHGSPSTGSGQGLGTVREVYSAGTVPVLAITKSEPTGVTRELIACLQK